MSTLYIDPFSFANVYANSMGRVLGNHSSHCCPRVARDKRRPRRTTEAHAESAGMAFRGDSCKDVCAAAGENGLGATRETCWEGRFFFVWCFEVCCPRCSQPDLQAPVFVLLFCLCWPCMASLVQVVASSMLQSLSPHQLSSAIQRY